MSAKEQKVGEAADYLENVVSAFGPDEGLELTQDAWERMREKIITLLAAVR